MAGPLDLESFAPNPYVEFKLRTTGETYRCLSDPDVDQVARMLRIEETMHNAETTEDMVAAMAEGKQLLVELIQDADPDRDVSGLKVGGTQILAVFNGIMHGESVAQAVMRGIAAETPDAPPDDESDDHGGLQPDDPERFVAVEGADAAPLVSEKPSPEPSSRSDDHADTLQAIGTG